MNSKQFIKAESLLFQRICDPLKQKLEDLPGCAVLWEAWEVILSANIILFIINKKLKVKIYTTLIR